MIHVLPTCFTISVLLVRTIIRNKLQNHNSALVGESASVDISMTRKTKKQIAEFCMSASCCV